MDEYRIPRPKASCLLQVTGGSMRGAGIVEGIVIVEKGREPRGGDIVIAEGHGEGTMKCFRREAKAAVLEAAQPRDPVICPRTELKLGGNPHRGDPEASPQKTAPPCPARSPRSYVQPAPPASSTPTVPSA